MSFSKHRKQLEELKTKDPEFYATLVKENPDLLNFGAGESEDDASASGSSDSSDGDSDSDEDSADDSASDADDDMPGARAASSGEKRSGQITLSLSGLKSIISGSLRERNMKDVRSMAHALRAVAWSDAPIEEQAKQQLRYTIPSAAVQQRALVAGLKHLPALMISVLGTLPTQGKASGKKSSTSSSSSASSTAASAASLAGSGPLDVTQFSGWQRQVTMVRSAVGSVLRLLPRLRDRDTQLFALRALRRWVPFFAPFPKPARHLLKHLLDVWGSRVPFASSGLGRSAHGRRRKGKGGSLQSQLRRSKGKGKGKGKGRPGARSGAGGAYSDESSSESEDSDDDDEGTQEDLGLRLVAFLRLRQAALELPMPAEDAVLKGMYQHYLTAASKVSASDLPRLALHSHCIVEALALRPAAAYRHAFVYLRQLAAHLRAAISARSEQATRMVQSWQFLSALRLWTAVLRAHGATPDAPLAELVYPCLQLLLGAAQASASFELVPLRLHLADLALQLAWATDQLVPVLPLCMAVLEAPQLHSKASDGDGGRPLGSSDPLRVLVRARPSLQRRMHFQDAVASRALGLVQDALRQHSCSVSFPELAGPVLMRLRKFARRCGGKPQWRAAARAVVDYGEARAAAVQRARESLEAAPTDLEAVRGFMAGERARVRAARLKSLGGEGARVAAQAKVESQAAAGGGTGKLVLGTARTGAEGSDGDSDGDSDSDSDGESGSGSGDDAGADGQVGMDGEAAGADGESSSDSSDDEDEEDVEGEDVVTQLKMDGESEEESDSDSDEDSDESDD